MEACPVDGAIDSIGFNIDAIMMIVALQSIPSPTIKLEGEERYFEGCHV
jgi:hypothetical protein